MASILQGTTPSLEIQIAESDFSVSDVTKLELTIANGSSVAIHDLTEVAVDADENTFTYSFTQAETLALSPSDMLYYQLRFGFQDGSIVGTRKASIRVSDLISEETL